MCLAARIKQTWSLRCVLHQFLFENLQVFKCKEIIEWNTGGFYRTFLYQSVCVICGLNFAKPGPAKIVLHSFYFLFYVASATR